VSTKSGQCQLGILWINEVVNRKGGTERRIPTAELHIRVQLPLNFLHSFFEFTIVPGREINGPQSFSGVSLNGDASAISSKIDFPCASINTYRMRHSTSSDL
jgi:hypothetical protein